MIYPQFFKLSTLLQFNNQNMLTCKQSYQQIVDNFLSIFHLNNFNIYIIMVNKGTLRKGLGINNGYNQRKME